MPSTTINYSKTELQVNLNIEIQYIMYFNVKVDAVQNGNKLRS